MHICPPPGDALSAWLKETSVLGKAYGHLLLEQANPISASLISALRPYFESAHQDAREVFHGDAGMDLHPDANAAGTHAQYPACLPPNARRGLFGEVLAGLVTEHYKMVEGHTWRVPAFLFRHHADARKYIFALARDSTRKREVYGRHGNDFIAVCLDANGAVERFLAGEAKWRKTLSPAVIETLMIGEWVKDDAGNRSRSGKGIWFELNREVAAPHGLRQLQEILKAGGLDKFAPTILSMDKILALKNAIIVPRTDLIVISGNAAATRKAGETLLPNSAAPAAYTAGRPLQVVEVILAGGQSLIDALYDSLWSTT
jgi:hypothetical protein